MKDYKIQVVVAPTPEERAAILARVAVSCGFARIPSDARKLIARDIRDVNLNEAYFVLCSDFNFRDSALTNHRLYQLSARGILVLLGVRSIPREYEILCTLHSG